MTDTVTIEVPASLVKDVDAWADANGLTREAAVVDLLAWHFETDQGIDADLPKDAA